MSRMEFTSFRSLNVSLHFSFFSLPLFGDWMPPIVVEDNVWIECVSNTFDLIFPLFDNEKIENKVHILK